MFNKSVRRKLKLEKNPKNPCFSQFQARTPVQRPKKCHHFNTLKDMYNSSKRGSTALRAERIVRNYNLRTQENKEQWKCVDNEIYFLNNNKHVFENNDNKSVLILGGGPSVNSVNWDNLEYDQIWSCNQFYKNKKIMSQKIDLAMICDWRAVRDDKQLPSLMKNLNLFTSFEINKGSVSNRHSKKQYPQIRSLQKKYPNNMSFLHTRYNSALGVGPRMIVFAAMLGFKNIYFVGLDGRDKKEKDGHALNAFEKNKSVPNWYKNYGDNFQERQFIIFWDYLTELSIQYDFNFYNLGQGTEHNVLSRLFAKDFPLPEEIVEKIK
jgi:hypothetical protein